MHAPETGAYRRGPHRWDVSLRGEDVNANRKRINTPKEGGEVRFFQKRPVNKGSHPRKFFWLFFAPAKSHCGHSVNCTVAGSYV